MSNDTDTKPKTRTRTKVARPPLHKVILVNDDFTPREFVVRVLKAEFRITEDQANRIMITAHTKGACVVAVFTQEVAETKATRATEMAREEGFPLLFTTEPDAEHFADASGVFHREAGEGDQPQAGGGGGPTRPKSQARQA